MLREPLKPHLGVLDCLPVLAQDHMLGGMLESEFRQPSRMRPGPGLAARKDPAVALPERLQVLALLAQVLHGGRTGSHQFAHRLVPRVWDPDARELAGAMEPGQGDSVPAIGLDALARPL